MQTDPKLSLGIWRMLVCKKSPRHSSISSLICCSVLSSEFRFTQFTEKKQLPTPKLLNQFQILRLRDLAIDVRTCCRPVLTSYLALPHTWRQQSKLLLDGGVRSSRQRYCCLDSSSSDTSSTAFPSRRVRFVDFIMFLPPCIISLTLSLRILWFGL